jgi:hypothetical protein
MTPPTSPTPDGTNEFNPMVLGDYTAKVVSDMTQIWGPGYQFEGVPSVCRFSTPGAITRREFVLMLAGYIGPVRVTNLGVQQDYIKQILSAPIDPEAKAIMLATLKDPLQPFKPENQSP